MRSQRPGSVRENGLRFKLTTLCLIGSGTCALAQQTVTVPPPTPSRGIVAANFIDPVGFGLSQAMPGQEVTGILVSVRWDQIDFTWAIFRGQRDVAIVVIRPHSTFLSDFLSPF